MATFEDVFVRPELNRQLGYFLGAGCTGLAAQCLAFRASRSLAGWPDLMRIHCLRCLWRWEMAPAGFLARDSSDVVAAPWLPTISPSTSGRLATWLPLDGNVHVEAAVVAHTPTFAATSQQHYCS